MRIEKMDELLIRINKLKNIRSIQYNDLFLTTNNKIHILPSLVVFYENMQCINLCINDKYFYELLKKVKEVYLEEKDKETDDLYFNPFYNNLGIKIEIDPLTQSLLDESNLDEINSLYSMYDKDKSYEQGLLFKEDELNTILPIIKYNIKETLNGFNTSIFFEDEINGYQDNYCLKADIDGRFSLIPIVITKESFNKYNVRVGGLFKTLNPLEIKIEFNNDSIRIANEIIDLKYSNSYEYKIENGVVVENHSMLLNEELKQYEETILPKTINELENLTNLGIKEELEWFILPWKSLYGFKKESNILSNVEKIEYIHNIYFSKLNDGFVCRDYISKNYKKKVKAYDDLNVELETVERVVTGVNLDNSLYVIESKFSDKGTNGYYKAYLRDKYFYHLCDKELSEISEEELVPLDSYNSGVINKADLLKKNKMYKLVKKGTDE